jgi:hypothetical protein
VSPRWRLPRKDFSDAPSKTFPRGQAAPVHIITHIISIDISPLVLLVLIQVMLQRKP